VASSFFSLIAQASAIIFGIIQFSRNCLIYRTRSGGLTLSALVLHRNEKQGDSKLPHSNYLGCKIQATHEEAGFLREKKYLLMDRDTKFSEAFRFILEQTGVKAVRLPPRSPNLNPNLERFMRSIKEECLERIIFFGEKSLQNAVAKRGLGAFSKDCQITIIGKNPVSLSTYGCPAKARSAAAAGAAAEDGSAA
jgi:hypothetical protein